MKPQQMRTSGPLQSLYTSRLTLVVNVRKVELADTTHFPKQIIGQDYFLVVICSKVYS